MEYLEVTLSARLEVVPYIEHVLQSNHITGWIEEDHRDEKSLIFFLPDDRGARKMIDNIGSIVRDLQTGEISIRNIREEDWEQSWKKHFTMQKVGRFMIKPTWEAMPPTGEGEMIIELDPGMAFGTGDHATTSLCLLLLQEYVKEGDRVIDLGTGSGILTIASLYLGAQQVISVDHDDVALKVAGENLKRLGLSSRVTLREDDVLTISEDTFDVAVGNLFLSEVRKLLESGCPPLKRGGIFIASGITSEQKAKVEESLARSDFTIVCWRTRDIWDAFVARKTGNSSSLNSRKI